jgi:uncharacterized protein YjbI with pentapeptide repeats
MKRMSILVNIMLGLLVTSAAWAQYLPPVEPLKPNSDHHQEDHSGHVHKNRDLHGINLSGANLTSASFVGYDSDTGQFVGSWAPFRMASLMAVLLSE